MRLRKFRNIMLSAPSTQANIKWQRCDALLSYLKKKYKKEDILSKYVRFYSCNTKKFKFAWCNNSNLIICKKRLNKNEKFWEDFNIHGSPRQLFWICRGIFFVWIVLHNNLNKTTLISLSELISLSYFPRIISHSAFNIQPCHLHISIRTIVSK